MKLDNKLLYIKKYLDKLINKKAKEIPKKKENKRE